MLRVPPALWATISKTEILLSKNTFAFLHDQGQKPTCRRLIDHLVGEREEHRRHIEAERSRGIEVGHQLEPGGLHNRKVPWAWRP
jgi:hypothetical protein